jgi:hypothetical protein
MPLNPVASPSRPMSHISKNSKYQKILLACVLLIVLVLLVSGLQNFESQGNVIIRLEQQGNDSDDSSAFLPSSQLFVILAFIVLSSILFFIVTLNRRKREFTILALLALFILFISIQPKTSKEDKSGASQEAIPLVAIEDLAEPESLPATSKSVEFTPPQISSFFLYLVSFLAIISLMFIVLIIYRWQTPYTLSTDTRSLEEIGEAARLALNDLAAGSDERDAVIACYVRMSDIVMRSKSIERGASRTATEFAARLEESGLPGSSVQRLTRLFETVRYGSHASNRIDAEEARECLAEIAIYCGETA